MRIRISAEKIIGEKLSDSNRKMDKDAYRDANSYRGQKSKKGEKEYMLRPTESIRLRPMIGLRGPMMEKWRVELMAEKFLSTL